MKIIFKKIFANLTKYMENDMLLIEQNSLKKLYVKLDSVEGSRLLYCEVQLKHLVSDLIYLAIRN